MTEERTLLPIKTGIHVAFGANIRGTPRMSAPKVYEDLTTLRSIGDVGVVQEFKMDYYWRQAYRVLIKRTKGGWNTSPHYRKSFADPVLGAQAVFWNRRVWKKITTRKMLLHGETPGISNDRYLRATLLEDRETGLRCWFGTTHFVVGGDRANDEPKRRKMLKDNISRLDMFLKRLERTGDPIWFNLDANIAQNSEAFNRFDKMLRCHGARYVGEKGIEYTFVIDSYDTAIEVTGASRIRPKAKGGRLNTDHEARITRFRLAGK